MFLRRAAQSFRPAATSRAMSAIYTNHRDVGELNEEETPFDFTTENYEEVHRLLGKYPSNYKQSACIPLLMLAQKQNDNFLSLSAMNKVAKIMEIPPMKVYQVASFYTMFNRTKVGKFHLQVCGTTPCMVRGSRDIMKAVEEFAGIKDGQTSEDGMFTVQEVECLGACTNAPMIQVNNEWFYEDLTPDNMKELLQKMQDGSELQPGPQIPERLNAIGPEGRTCLDEMPNGVFDRDFESDVAAWKQAKEEAAAKK